MTTFDDFAFIYDGAIDWETRLGRELPFLLSHIPQAKRPRILDLACGSGRHLVALASRGLRVVGLDKSPTMIATAKQMANRAEVEVDLVIGDMVDASKLVKGHYDEIICIGNSLALLESLNALKQVLT